MAPKRCAGLIYGPEAHYIDHLAPLCQSMRVPLICTEEEIAAQASRYYPHLQVIYSEYLTIAEQVVSDYDVILYSMPRDLFDEVFFFAQKWQRKKVHTIWCPHGNSDKGNQSVFLEALRKETVALVYGQKMIDFFKAKGVFDPLKAHVITGNYRYQFYLDHQDFYDALISEQVLKQLPKAEKTALYAPTWQDREHSSSFFAAAPSLIETLPPDWNLIIKLHPNLSLQDPFKVETCIERYEDHPHVLFLIDFPPIYPLLNAVDLYIGDLSSIGYDFLAFDKPLFFLNQSERNPQTDPGLYLYRCGTEIKPAQYPRLYNLIADWERFEVRDLSKIRKEVYTYTFGQAKPLATLCQEIQNVFASFPDQDEDLFV